MRRKVESEERNMVLAILRTTGVVTLIAEDYRKIGSTTDENREGKRENGIIRMIFVYWRVIRVSDANIKALMSFKSP